VNEPEASVRGRRLLLVLLAAYVFLWWAAFTAFDVIRLGGPVYPEPRSLIIGLGATACVIAAARFQWRAWNSAAELGAAVLTSVGAAVAIFGLGLGLVAPRQGATPSTAARTFRDPNCHTPVVATDAFTWACTTMTIQPWEFASGTAVAITYRFRAKRTLHYVAVCFPGVSTDRCLYAHRYPTIERGTVIERVVHDVAGDESTTVSFDILNETSFYKSTPEVAAAVRERRTIDPSATLRSTWWWVGAGHVCVIVSGSNAGCNWGRE
jgi:hypothetical protein